MRRIYSIFSIACLAILAVSAGHLYAALDNNWVINHEMAERIKSIKKNNGYSSQDFNACQVTWTMKPLKKTAAYSRFQPHEITFRYNNEEIIKLVNTQDGKEESIKGLGLNCLEFNNYVYLFFDTIDYDTRVKFDLTDLSYVIYSSDSGHSWSDLKSLHPFSVKAKFILPHGKFSKYVKIFGDDKNHALSIFNLRDETTYLFDPEFDILRTVSVYNRLSDFDYPTDFHFHKNVIYLIRGSCETVKGRLQCPELTYMETSTDFGGGWKKEKLSFVKKSYLITSNDSLYQIYFTSCPTNWFGLVPALNRSHICGRLQVRRMNEEEGTWEEPKTLLKTVDKIIGFYKDKESILVWQDFRFHKSRPCGFIPLIGCVDSTPFTGPTVIYAGELNTTDWTIKESIIDYQN